MTWARLSRQAAKSQEWRAHSILRSTLRRAECGPQCPVMVGVSQFVTKLVSFDHFSINGDRPHRWKARPVVIVIFRCYIYEVSSPET
jgi:hypothetical protein